MEQRGNRALAAQLHCWPPCRAPARSAPSKRAPESPVLISTPPSRSLALPCPLLLALSPSPSAMDAGPELHGRPTELLLLRCCSWQPAKPDQTLPWPAFPLSWMAVPRLLLAGRAPSALLCVFVQPEEEESHAPSPCLTDVWDPRALFLPQIYRFCAHALKFVSRVW